jgi:hypothetical protein
LRTRFFQLLDGVQPRRLLSLGLLLAPRDIRRLLGAHLLQVLLQLGALLVVGRRAGVYTVD